MVLGYRIKNLRKEYRMSQADLGKVLGVSKVSVSAYEKGKRIPSLDVFYKMLDFFKISADYLLGRELMMVCENDENLSIAVSNLDILVLREIKKKKDLYNMILNDPKRFFSLAEKKDM